MNLNKKTKKPLVSILVTVYNRESYLSDCLRSILNSSWQDWEGIILDDASSDSSFQIAQEFAALDSRFKTYKNNENLGQFEARNYIACLAQGKYIKYLDSDDMLYPFGLETMVRGIEKFPDAGVAISHDKLHENLPYPIYMDSKHACEAYFYNKGFPNSGPSASIINRKVFNDVNGFPKPYYVGTDSLLWLKIASVSGIVKMKPALIWYRIHDGQAFSSGINSNEYLKMDYNYLIEFLNSKSLPFTAKAANDIRRNLKKNQLRKLIRLALIEHKFLIAYKYFNYNKFGLRDLFNAIK